MKKIHTDHSSYRSSKSQPNSKLAMLALVFLGYWWASGHAVACAKQCESAEADHMMRMAHLDRLEEKITVRLPLGITLRVPIGYLGGRSGYREGQVLNAREFNYYFCFPSGEYSVPAMSSYFPTALRNYDPQRVPVHVLGVTEHDPKFINDLTSLDRGIVTTLENAKKGFPGQTFKLDQAFGLTRITQSSNTGAFADIHTYVSQDDSQFNVYITEIGTMKVDPSVRIRAYNRDTGFAVDFHIPGSEVAGWREILFLIQKQFHDWQE